jgi:hypothetical protein
VNEIGLDVKDAEPQGCVTSKLVGWLVCQSISYNC